MFRIIRSAEFVPSPWKNGGGVTYEIARSERAEGWRWRLSIAEVASDGPFSRFEGLSRILTVIEGNGVDLHTPDGVLQARLQNPVHFSGDLPVHSRLLDGPIRDLNVIYDARVIEARVQVICGPERTMTGPEHVGFLCLVGTVTVATEGLAEGAFALGGGGEIALASGAVGVLVTLRDLA